MGLVLFVITFLSLYAAVHALVFWGAYPLLAGHPALPALTGVWMLLMVLAPVAVRLLDRAGLPGSARALAWIGYSWMGFVFLAFSAFALVALWHLLARAGLSLFPGLPFLTVHRPAGAALVMLLVLATGLYGFFEARHLTIEEIRLETAKLPPAVTSLRIVQVSDLHLGLINREEALAPVISAIADLQPDLVVATGDMVDAQMDHLETLTHLWRDIQPPLGKFAVTGNHENYAGLEQALEFMRRSGFEMLRNEVRQVGDLATLVGVDDPAGGGDADEAALLETSRSDRFTVLLKHRPRVRESAAGLFDLQLSGHAHRGQIYPFNYLTALEYPLQDGLYSLPGGGRLYASRGTGTWGPPMRVLSPPEVTLFVVTPTR